MGKKLNKPPRSRTSTLANSCHKPGIPDEEERILREATQHLVFEHGMYLVATDLREASVKGFKVWIITVTLRYPTGHEGYVGDLLFDGEGFTFLTPPEVSKERITQIAGDPERKRKWDEHRATPLPARKG